MDVDRRMFLVGGHFTLLAAGSNVLHGDSLGVADFIWGDFWVRTGLEISSWGSGLPTAPI